MTPETAGRKGVAGRLRRLWSGNNRLRMLLTLELAVALPAAGLVFANFSYLKSIERNKVLEAAIHRDFQQMLAISEKQINLKMYATAETARKAFPCPEQDSKPQQVLQLDRILAKNPRFAHVFVYDAGQGLILRSQPALEHDPYALKERERLAKMLNGWMEHEGKMVVGALHKKSRPFAWSTEKTKRSTGYGYTAAAYFLLQGLPADRVALGGVVFEPEYLKRTFFPEMLEELIAHKLEEEGGNPLAMSVLPAEADGEWVASPAMMGNVEPLAASAGWNGGTPEVSRNFSDVFRGLALGIKFQGKSVAALGRSWIRRSFWMLGVLTLLLVGGLVFAYRSVCKEMEVARLKSDFVSNVSHELRTPLSLIRLYAETLELGRIKTQEKVEEYYRIIRKESERLTALINNILDFSRIEAGRKEYEFRQTDLAELVCNTLDTYRDQIDEQGFTFEQSIDSTIPPVRVDREAIARSLVNLVNNALKYSADEKYLRVRLYRTDGVAKLEVVDRGIGIARGEQAKIFEKFYRAGDPLVHNTKGSGLGLSLVRHIAHAHGGEVEVESAPGKGSTFTLWLPLEAPARQQTSDAA